jgi:hypothetical protein
VASYQDLLDAIAQVGAATGDDRAWMTGLSSADLEVVTSPFSVVSSPSAIADVLAKIRAQHRQSVEPPPAAAEGRAAEAIRIAETSLAQQNSVSAQIDLQVITAVLNAHTTHAAGRAALDGLQDDIEAAVANRTDLDTPAGARAFQRYLIGKLRDIKAVVETAGLDDTSKASLAAALAALYASTTTDSADEHAPEQKPVAPPVEHQPPAADIPADLGTYLFDDTLLPDDLAPLPTSTTASQPATAPMVPPVAAIPALGGGSGGQPAGPAPIPLSLDRLMPTRLPADDSVLDDPLLDVPLEEVPGEPGVKEDDRTGEEPAAPTPDDETVVHLPNGETVTAPSPQLAAVITAAVAGTPIPEAFRQQGITIPAPGTAVPSPVDPAQVIPGDIGMLTDRHALALGNGKAVLNNQIQPITGVSGPTFLGWEHPPGPGSGTPTPRSDQPTQPDQPTPTRPEVTAGPPIGE